MTSDRAAFIVPERLELLLAAGLAACAGTGLLVVELVVGDVSNAAILGVNVVVAAAVGGVLHLIERDQRLADLDERPPPPSNARLESLVRTFGRQAVLVGVSALLTFLFLWAASNSVWLAPGIFLGAAVWLVLDARLLESWERQNAAEVLRIGDFGFTWLRRSGDRRYVSRRRSADSQVDVLIRD